MRRFNYSATIQVAAFVIIAFIGFADSVYLTATHYMSGVPTCTVLEGCDEVALSDYSTIGPIPISLFGTLFYAIMMIWGVIWFDTRKKDLFHYMPFITVPAFFFSMWLIYLMFFVIKALCIYCLISGATTTLIMLLSFQFRNRM